MLRFYSQSSTAITHCIFSAAYFTKHGILSRALDSNYVRVTLNSSPVVYAVPTIYVVTAVYAVPAVSAALKILI